MQWIDDELKDMVWLLTIPPCPRLECDLQDPDKWARGTHWKKEMKVISDHYHPGSTACYRGISNGAFARSGQQCCYKNGHLRTSGLEAGTPDRTSPEVSKSDHIHDDVDMFSYCKRYLGDQWVTDEYHRVRPPSTGIPYGY